MKPLTRFEFYGLLLLVLTAAACSAIYSHRLGKHARQRESAVIRRVDKYTLEVRAYHREVQAYREVWEEMKGGD